MKEILEWTIKHLDTLITEFEQQKFDYQDNLEITTKLDEIILELYATMHQIEYDMLNLK